MPTLVYSGGKNPFLNLESFITHVKKRYPTISQGGINQLVKMEVGKLRPRMPNLYCHLYGRDIMTEDIEDLAIWPYLPPGDQKRLLAHPIVGGMTFDKSDDPMGERMRLIQTLDRASVNRSALISLDGLENSYVWCNRNNWRQEVTEEDKRLILSSPGRHLFHDEEMLGPYIDVRTYSNLKATESFTARDASDVRALQRQFTRKQSWSGTDLKG